jgi:hypothetical protein
LYSVGWLFKKGTSVLTARSKSCANHGVAKEVPPGPAHHANAKGILLQLKEKGILPIQNKTGRVRGRISTQIQSFFRGL